MLRALKYRFSHTPAWRRLAIIALAGTLFLSAGIAAVGVGRGGEEDRFLTAVVERGRVMTTVSATGKLDAVVTVEVGSQLSGQVERLFADFNDSVEKGQAIAQLDERSFLAKVKEAEAALEAAKASVLIRQADLERAHSNLATVRARSMVLQANATRAQTALAAAQRDLNRVQQLKQKGATSDRRFDLARTTRDSASSDKRATIAEAKVHTHEIGTALSDVHKFEAELLNANAILAQRQAQLTQARILLERTVIRSPINGVVISRDIDEGQTVAASFEAPKLFKIAQDLKKMEVHAKIDEADIGRMKVGQRAVFRVDAFRDREFEARIVQVRKAPEVIKNVVAYRVVLSTHNVDMSLLPGMTAMVRIVVDEADGVLKVPNAALRFRPPGAGQSHFTGITADQEAPGHGAATVWLLDDDGEPKPVNVRLGKSDEMAAQVIDGPLREGQRIVIGMSAPPEESDFFGLGLGL